MNKKKDKRKLMIIVVIIIFCGYIIFSTNLKSNELKDNGKTYEIKIDAQDFIKTAKENFTTKLLNGEKIDHICLSISQDNYIGSVYYEKSGENRIWLSNGKLYVYGDYNNLSVVESSNIATTSCTE